MLPKRTSRGSISCPDFPHPLRFPWSWCRGRLLRQSGTPCRRSFDRLIELLHRRLRQFESLTPPIPEQAARVAVYRFATGALVALSVCLTKFLPESKRRYRQIVL